MRAAAFVLTIGAALADSGGSHAAAYYLLLGAVPAATVAALATLGDLVEAGTPIHGRARAQVLFGRCVAGLLVVTTAARSTALLSGHVPRVAFSALVGCLALYLLQGSLAGVAELKRRSHAPVRPAHADRPLSRAA
jgi:uncharacterized membrane protein YfcA